MSRPRSNYSQYFRPYAIVHSSPTNLRGGAPFPPVGNIRIREGIVGLLAGILYPCRLTLEPRHRLVSGGLNVVPRRPLLVSTTAKSKRPDVSLSRHYLNSTHEPGDARHFISVITNDISKARPSVRWYCGDTRTNPSNWPMLRHFFLIGLVVTFYGGTYQSGAQRRKWSSLR